MLAHKAYSMQVMPDSFNPSTYLRIKIHIIESNVNCSRSWTKVLLVFLKKELKQQFKAIRLSPTNLLHLLGEEDI